MSHAAAVRRAHALALAFLLGVLAAPLAYGEEKAAYREAKITYLTSASIYVEAGSDEGLEVGHSVEVVRAGAVVATLRVTDVSSHKAVCVKEGGETVLSVGDTVRFVPKPIPAKPAPPAAGTSAAARPAESPMRRFGLRGRVGMSYQMVHDRKGNEGSFSIPALNLFLDGTQLGGAPIDLNVDIRSRRIYRSVPGSPSTTEDYNSVYRLAVAWQEPRSPWRVTVGRQFSPSLASINIFDGAEGEYRSARFSTGVFAGSEPKDGAQGYSNDIRDYGGFFQWRNAPGAERRWSLTAGAIGSYTQSEINREFTYLQGSYVDSRLSVWVAEELDLNRGWKKEAEGKSYSLTSTFLNARYRLSDAWSFNAGYDNRRNVRLYRDWITPVTQFDDQYRTGAWAGTTFRFARHFSIGADLKSSAGGAPGSADGYSFYFGANRLTSVGLDVRTRSTRYTNDRVEGWLHSLSVGASLGQRWYAEIQGGVRDETSRMGLPGTSLTWYGIDADVTLGSHWFLMLSLERDQGDLEANDQAYISFAYRF